MPLRPLPTDLSDLLVKKSEKLEPNKTYDGICNKCYQRNKALAKQAADEEVEAERLMAAARVLDDETLVTKRTRAVSAALSPSHMFQLHAPPPDSRGCHPHD